MSAIQFRNRLFLFLLVVFVTTAIPGAKAARKIYQLKDGTVSIDVPKQWKAVTKFLGLPLTVLGPKVGGARPLVIVNPLGVKAPRSFSKKGMRSAQEEYRDGRRAWIGAKNGKIKRFYSYRFEKWPFVKEVHGRGYRYQINSAVIDEYTYLVICKGALFHLKTMLREAHNRRFASIVRKTLRSFRCH